MSDVTVTGIDKMKAYVDSVLAGTGPAIIPELERARDEVFERAYDLWPVSSGSSKTGLRRVNATHLGGGTAEVDIGIGNTERRTRYAKWPDLDRARAAFAAYGGQGRAADPDTWPEPGSPGFTYRSRDHDKRLARYLNLSEHARLPGKGPWRDLVRTPMEAIAAGELGDRLRRAMARLLGRGP